MMNDIRFVDCDADLRRRVGEVMGEVAERHTRLFGNIKQRKFSEIWQDTSDPIMAGLKDRLDLLKGKCGRCRFKDVCGGGLRARAEITSGDPWAADPACYLSEEEIA